MSLKGIQLAMLPYVAPYAIENPGVPAAAAEKKCSGGMLRRPALRYQGGKWKLAGWILEHFPEHQRYVEPYGGAFSLGLKKVPVAEAVYCDRNWEVVNFFQQLQQCPQALIAAIETSPRTLLEFQRCQQSEGAALERARRFYLRSQMSFTNGGGRWSGGTSQSRLQLVQRQSDEHLWVVAERLQGVAIEVGLAVECLRRYDSPTTLFYIDPPYVHSARGSKDKRHQSLHAQPRRQYAYELLEADHRELGAVLRSLAGAVVLSGYPSEMYEALFPDWRRVEKVVRTTSRGARVEALWIKPAAVRRQLWAVDQVARLEAERERILAEGAPAPKGAWIEAYTARRRRKSGKVVCYTYYRFRYPAAGAGEAKHRSLGKYGSGKYLAAEAAIRRRKQLDQVERRIRDVEAEKVWGDC